MLSALLLEGAAEIPQSVAGLTLQQILRNRLH